MMFIARIDPETDTVLNLEVCSEEWFNAANAEHAADPTKPYFVEWVDINDTSNPVELRRRGRPTIGLKWRPNHPQGPRFDIPPPLGIGRYVHPADLYPAVEDRPGAPS